MQRLFLTSMLALGLAGCASSGSYYRYDAGGDYYTGTSGPEVVYQGSPYYGGFGYSHGFGHGSGFGYGFGYGYGYGYGPYSPWGYGYPPVFWWPDYSVNDGALRQQRVERERADRAALVWRPTVAAPRNVERDAGWRNPQPAYRFDHPVNGLDTRSNTGFRDTRPARIIRPAPADVVTRSSSDSSPGIRSGSAPMPPPRISPSAPISRKQ